MLFDYCQTQADTPAGDVVPMDLSILGKGRGKKGKGKKSESSKGEKDKDGDKKAMPKRPSTFLDTVLSARPGRMRRRIAGGMRVPIALLYFFL